MKILSDRMLRIKDSAEHSRCTYVDRPSRSADKRLHNNAPHRKCLREKATACVSLLVFFKTRRGIFPYSVEDDAISTISQTPTTHYTNTCVKLTIVTHHLSFSERVAIANLPLYRHTPSDQSRVYRVTQLRIDGVHCQESAGTGPVVFKVLLVKKCAAFAGHHRSNIVRLFFPTPNKWYAVVVLLKYRRQRTPLLIRHCVTC